MGSHKNLHLKFEQRIYLKSLSKCTPQHEIRAKIEKNGRKKKAKGRKTLKRRMLKRSFLTFKLTVCSFIMEIERRSDCKHSEYLFLNVKHFMDITAGKWAKR